MLANNEHIKQDTQYHYQSCFKRAFGILNKY